MRFRFEMHSDADAGLGDLTPQRLPLTCRLPWRPRRLNEPQPWRRLQSVAERHPPLDADGWLAVGAGEGMLLSITARSKGANTPRDVNHA